MTIHACDSKYTETEVPKKYRDEFDKLVGSLSPDEYKDIIEWIDRKFEEIANRRQFFL